MNKKVKKKINRHFSFSIPIIIFSFFFSSNSIAQSTWPSESWNSAVNLTSVMSSGGLTDLSGLFWNGNTNRLYVSNGNGALRILQFNATTNTFTQWRNISYSAGPEGITQANLDANEFFTIDEDSYQIRKYTHPADFSSISLSRSWNLLAAPSTMTNTANVGPEGITFIPDSFLNAIGFINQATGAPYTSNKGMGGLFFVAHQNLGYIWVYDVNPNVNNDFAFIGKYLTNKSESCDLTFDRTTGLLYILHNTGGNFIEVTDMKTTSQSGGARKFVTKAEYQISNPPGTNVNIEGLAINSKCTDSTNVSLWLCRDVESIETLSYRQDCLRWFNPFNAPGSCNTVSPVALNLKMYIQGFYLGNNLMVPALHAANQTICDSIIVELHQATGQHSLVSSVKSTININGNGTFIFPSTVFGNSYYIVVRHRNALETWSASPVLFNSSTISYSFTDAINKAYGNNLKNIGGGNFALFSGDVDQNGTIRTDDINSIKFRAQTFASGYIKDDINGDFLIESSDFSIVENNSFLSISVAKP